MKLYINTTNNLRTLIRLDESETLLEYQSPREQDVLGVINLALEKDQKGWSDISEIEVHPGPGSFTGIRVGISVAQALSLSLGIPVNGQPVPSIITPDYGKPASITPPKKRI